LIAMACRPMAKHGEALMPIHRQYRWFYPIDWPQLSASIRFGRGKGAMRALSSPPRPLGIPSRGPPVVGRRGDHMVERRGQGAPRPAGAPARGRWRDPHDQKALATAHLDPNNRPQSQRNEAAKLPRRNGANSFTTRVTTPARASRARARTL
jgi:hypothetical protein